MFPKIPPLLYIIRRVAVARRGVRSGKGPKEVFKAAIRRSRTFSQPATVTTLSQSLLSARAASITRDRRFFSHICSTPRLLRSAFVQTWRGTEVSSSATGSVVVTGVAGGAKNPQSLVMTGGATEGALPLPVERRSDHSPPASTREVPEHSASAHESFPLR